jgi:3-hydroxybutyryl-CoA dehydrogenase
MPESTPSVSTSAPLVGIIGCGVMGRGIAQIAVLSGATVFLADANAGAAAAARRTLTTTFTTLVGKGKLQEDDASDALARLHVCSELADLADCDVIIEAIIEDLAAKKTLFATLETLVRSDAILASNTSSLSVTAIAAGLQHPQRVAGFHFFNPVPLMKIVEVIGGILTSESVVAQLLALGRHWGHAAVRAKDTPGFIVNHAGRGFGTEGLRILSEGVTSVATLDRILRDTAGFKLGPCELMDMTGLDVSHPVMESIYRQYYDEPRFRPQGLTRQMLTAGLLGKKTGRGFYAYDENGKKVLPAEVAVTQTEPGPVWLSRAEPALAERLLAAGYVVESGATPSAQALCIVTPLGQDCTDCVVREGLDARRTVAIDALFDSPTHHVLMTNPATDPAYLAQACGLFGRDGARISVLQDSTGLVAQRVLAHIINIACDIAQQGIALPADIDRGVVLGLGYPQGPLAWGDQLGAATVLRILHNIERLSGDARYRPSPWLQRRAALGLSLLHAPG